MPEDHPDVGLLRAAQIAEVVEVLFQENRKYGEMTGDSKTAVACREEPGEDGMRMGMQGFYGRFVFTQKMREARTPGSEIDPLLVCSRTALLQMLRDRAERSVQPIKCPRRRSALEREQR